MILRIVKLTFQKEYIPDFLEIFEESKHRIRTSKGCNFVELYQDQTNECVFFTYSCWDDVYDLDQYRNSSFFKDVWGRTKILFSDKPEAWSVSKLQSLH